MTAVIIPFPIARLRVFIQKQADHVASMNPDAGVRYIERLMEMRGGAMRRRAIAEELISRELKCLETAIRVALIPYSRQG